jgi:hypothetical protein
MKKAFLVLFAAALMLAGCGVGSQTVVSGKADEAAVVFFSDQSYSIDVTVDGRTYRVDTVKDSEFKAKRNIKKTTQNMIYLTPGQHDVNVTRNGRTVTSQKIFVSAGDTKIIRL